MRYSGATTSIVEHPKTFAENSPIGERPSILRTAATPIHLYPVAITKECDAAVPVPVVENVCLLLRCFAESALAEETILHSCIYVNAGLCVLYRLTRMDFAEDAWAAMSWLAVALFLLECTIFTLILGEILNFMIAIFENNCFTKPLLDLDFDALFLKVSKGIHSDPVILARLTVELLKVMPNGHWGICLVGYLPSLIGAGRKETVVPVVKTLTNRSQNVEKLGIVQTLSSLFTDRSDNHVQFLTSFFSLLEDPNCFINGARFSRA
jgi:hypothetical protein